MHSIKNILHNAYNTVARRPLVGITTDASGEDFHVRQKYIEQVQEAGGLAVLLPPTTDATIMRQQLQNIDAIIFTGGGDHNPLWYGENPIAELGNINPLRDKYELPLCTLAYDMNIPMLGICRGMQTIAIALGGHVVQHSITYLKHSQQAPKDEPTHSVVIEEKTMLRFMIGEEKIFVNSFHHQAVDDTGTRLKATAHAADGVIEAIESAEQRPLLAVQWHPEQMGEQGLPLFKWIVREGHIFYRAKRIHKESLTFDAHCDTPMLFSKGADIISPSDIALYDLRKMNNGMIAATAMVCYLPQPKDGQTFSQCVDFDVQTPNEYANLIIDRLHEITAKTNEINIAYNTYDLIKAVKRNTHAILLGIENGLALEGQLSQIEHFFNKGVRYITLCHNGDNDICDSAKEARTHGGLSAFGEQVVREMNRLGMIIDLSHASEDTFYHVLNISKKPVVCTHSNCRALCDHPRNITDEQMKALAEAGGILHLTLYHGFLRDDDQEATIRDFIRHLRHAIDIMGIDHVGIGTDFDGDGGVKGAASAADMINITRHMMTTGFSDTDIKKIWGGNFIRIMKENII